MASSKPKKTANKKPKSTKTKVTAESVKPEEPETVAEETKTEEVVAETEATETPEVTEKAEAETVEPEEVKEDAPKETEKKCECSDKCEEPEAIVSETPAEPGFFKKMFACKHDGTENILTIFNGKKIWGALIAEMIGTMVISMFLLTLGAYQPIYLFFMVLGVTGLFFSISGANLNPLITVGMMASRRMPVIRGVLYILAQILGAWVGYLICSGFVGITEGAAELPVMAQVDPSMFWVVTFIELLGSFLVALSYARAISTKKNPLVVASLYAGGLNAAFIIVIIISSTWLSLNNNFMMNPAVALMYQILPTGGNNFGDLLADIGLALVTYVVGPMLAGTLGFYVSDLIETFNESK